MQEQHEPPATHLGEAEETTHVVPPESEWPPASEDAGVYDPDEEDEDDGF